MTTRRNIGRRFATRSLLTGIVLVGSAVAAGAQSTAGTPDPRWVPWIGCWQPSGTDAATAGNPGAKVPTVCATPASASSAVELVAFVDGQITARQLIDASGARREIERDGCAGWESAEWSATGRRVYLRSEYTCQGGLKRASTGIMAFSADGGWLDVQSVGVGTNNGVRVIHYRSVPVPAGVPAEMKPLLEGHSLAASTARLAASDSVRIADVIEATKRVDGLVAQTWLAERGQGFGLDARKLVQLADAGVPTNVIDLMVALSYPRAFAINLARSDGQIVPTEQTRAAAESETYRGGPIAFMNWDPFYSASCYGDWYGYSGYNSSRACSRYGFYGFGYSPYGRNGWYYGNRPIIVTRPTQSVDTPERRQGRMVRGRGYTRPSDSDRGTAQSGRSGDGSRSGGSSTGSSSGSKGSSDSGSGRKATPRSP